MLSAVVAAAHLRVRLHLLRVTRHVALSKSRAVPAKAGRVLVQATRLTRELCGLLTAGIHQD